MHPAAELGWTEIAVSVISDLSDLDRLLVERDENTCRKEMSPAEKTLLFNRIEAIQKRLTPTGAAAHKSDNLSDLNPESRRSRDKAAKAAGISAASAACHAPQPARRDPRKARVVAKWGNRESHRNPQKTEQPFERQTIKLRFPDTKKTAHA